MILADCWKLNTNNIGLNAVPNTKLGIGTSVTCEYTSGFDANGGVSGASVGLTLTDSQTVTYHAVCINPATLWQSCLYYKTSDNLGETTSAQITTFTTYVGTAFPISNEWTHIYVGEDLHFISCAPNAGTYNMETLQVGGGFNFNA